MSNRDTVKRVVQALKTMELMAEDAYELAAKAKREVAKTSTIFFFKGKAVGYEEAAEYLKLALRALSIDDGDKIEDFMPKTEDSPEGERNGQTG